MSSRPQSVKLAERVNTGLFQVRQGLLELRQSLTEARPREQGIRIGRCLEALKCAEVNLAEASELAEAGAERHEREEE